MSEKTILGHIDCPICGTAKAMRITHDKNGHPFGSCQNESCFGQLRVGGKDSRIAAFLRRFPWARAGQNPVTATATEQPDTKKAETVQVQNPVHVPVPAKPARRPVANPFDFLLKGQA